MVLGSAFVLFLKFFVGFFGPWALTPLVDWAHLDFSYFMHFSPCFLSNLPACINFTNTRGKRLEINPTSMLILPFCPFYAGVDGVELSFNSCQLAPPHLALYSSRVKVKHSRKVQFLQSMNKYMNPSKPYLCTCELCSVYLAILDNW